MMSSPCSSSALESGTSQTQASSHPELREDEGCGGHEQEELGHRDPLLTAVLHLRVLRAPDQRAISDDGRELTAQSFCLCVAEQEGGTDVVAPALLEVDGLLRPPGLRLLLRQAQPIVALSSAPRRRARAGAIAEARTMRCGRCSWFGKVVSGRSGEAGRPRRGPKPIGHSSSRQIAFCPRRSAWQSEPGEKSPIRREMALSAERWEAAAHGGVLLRPGLGHLSLGVSGAHRSGDGKSSNSMRVNDLGFCGLCVCVGPPAAPNRTPWADLGHVYTRNTAVEAGVPHSHQPEPPAVRYQHERPAHGYPATPDWSRADQFERAAVQLEGS